MALVDAILRVIEKDEDVFVPCEDKKNQESIRTMLFHIRKKFPGAETAIGISKFSYGNQLFVKVYKQTAVEFFVLNDLGVPVPVTTDAINSSDNARQVELMRRDGMSDEDITKALVEE